jgi:hypothetical protein
MSHPLLASERKNRKPYSTGSCSICRNQECLHTVLDKPPRVLSHITMKAMTSDEITNRIAKSQMLAVLLHMEWTTQYQTAFPCEYLCICIMTKYRSVYNTLFKFSELEEFALKLYCNANNFILEKASLCFNISAWIIWFFYA